MRFVSVGGALAVLLAFVGVSTPIQASDQPAVPVVRSPIAAERFYFVMTDRYRDGDPANNRGGLQGPISVTGFEPSSDAYFHGGDLQGLTGACDVGDPNDHGLARLRRLGFTALWITPPFVQRTVQGDSAAYHGYWFLDLSKPDPHLGTQADMQALMECARKLDMKVFLDVVVNHTADVITYRQGNAYVPIRQRPYRTAAGKVFNPFRFTNGTFFPKLSRAKSFAKTPIVPAEFRDAKVPAFLNDVRNYHNRGDIDWGSCSGVCLMDGDFVGLDDLMTEDWRVVSGLAEAYGAWITEYGVDGFRLDTAKHVDPYFFGRWLPLINETANAAGRNDFTSFGEVWESDPVVLSETMIRRQLPSVLDFPYQEAVRSFATGRGSGRTLALLFDDDDLYTTRSTNAYGLTTFLGNHDMGRIGFFLDRQSVDKALLDRARLAHSVLYLTRGVPVVYYGDEVGMTGSGDGKDKRARQDMFVTQVPVWRSESRIGGSPIGDRSGFEVGNPLEVHLASLAELRDQYPALATGAQITRGESAGSIVLSRIDSSDRREYLVAFNTDGAQATLTVPTATPASGWSAILGPAAPLASGADGRVQVTVPARGAVVWRADERLPAAPAPGVAVTTRTDRATDRLVLTAALTGPDPARVSFEVQSGSSQSWTPVGTDDAPPYRVYLDRPAQGLLGPITVRAVAESSSGAVATSPVVRVRAADPR